MFHCKAGSSEVAPVHSMKAYGNLEVLFHSFLNLTLDGWEWSA